MKKHFTKDFLRTLVGLSLALVIGLGVNYVAADWQGPSGAPTSGNPNNLLTTGFDQIKTGKLSVKSTTLPPLLGSGPGTVDLFGLQVGDYTNAYNAGQKGIWSNGPLGVAGNTILAGNVEIGPTLQTAQNPVTLNVTGIANVIGAANVTDNLRVSDKQIIGAGNITTDPAYNLHLVGNTNIGRGNTCTLAGSDADDGCPIGSYVYNVNYVQNCETTNYGYQTGPCTIVKCRYVNPVSSPQDLGICGGSSGSGSTTPMTVNIAHHWPIDTGYGSNAVSSATNPNDGIGHQNTTGYGMWNYTHPSTEWSTTSSAELVPTLSPLCLVRDDYTTMTNVMNSPVVLDASAAIAPIAGGVPPYTYSWYKKEYNGIFPISFVPFSVDTPTVGGWTLVSSTVSSLPNSVASFNVKTYHINRQDDTTPPVLKTYYWAVLVTDSTGAKATDQYGAHDLWHCPAGYAGNN